MSFDSRQSSRRHVRKLPLAESTVPTTVQIVAESCYNVVGERRSVNDVKGRKTETERRLRGERNSDDPSSPQQRLSLANGPPPLCPGWSINPSWHPGVEGESIKVQVASVHKPNIRRIHTHTHTRTHRRWKVSLHENWRRQRRDGDSPPSPPRMTRDLELQEFIGDLKRQYYGKNNTVEGV